MARMLLADTPNLSASSLDGAAPSPDLLDLFLVEAAPHGSKAEGRPAIQARQPERELQDAG